MEKDNYTFYVQLKEKLVERCSEHKYNPNIIGLGEIMNCLVNLRIKKKICHLFIKDLESLGLIKRVGKYKFELVEKRK